MCATQENKDNNHKIHLHISRTWGRPRGSCHGVIVENRRLHLEHEQAWKDVGLGLNVSVLFRVKTEFWAKSVSAAKRKKSTSLPVSVWPLVANVPASGFIRQWVHRIFSNEEPLSRKWVDTKRPPRQTARACGLQLCYDSGTDDHGYIQPHCSTGVRTCSAVAR